MISSILTNEDVAAVIRTLSPSPRLLPRLSTVFATGDVDLSEFTAIIHADATLPRGLMRVANTEPFAREEDVTTIDEAIARLGERQACRITGALIANEVYVERLALYDVSAGALRQNALFVGLVNEQLAPALGLDPHTAYLAGLFRSVGKVVLNAIATKTAAIDPFVEGGLPLLSWERENAGYANPEAMYDALRAWHFPPAIVEAVCSHYERDDGVSPDACALAISAACAESAGFGLPGEHAYWCKFEDLCRGAGIDEAAAHAAARTAQRTFDRLRAAVVEK